MATITWRVGEDRRLLLEPREPSGATPLLSGATARLEISTSAACHVIDLVPVTGGFELQLDADTLSGLSTGAHRTALVLAWPDGTVEADDGHRLVIREGC